MKAELKPQPIPSTTSTWDDAWKCSSARFPCVGVKRTLPCFFPAPKRSLTSSVAINVSDECGNDCPLPYLICAVTSNALHYLPRGCAHKPSKAATCLVVPKPHSHQELHTGLYKKCNSNWQGLMRSGNGTVATKSYLHGVSEWVEFTTDAVKTFVPRQGLTPGTQTSSR